MLRCQAMWRETQRQLVLFPEHRFAPPEAIRGELADRPRKRKRK